MKYKTGNLITAAQECEVDVIIHQCNCFVNMGSGIAPQIKQAFPAAWAADQATTKGSAAKLGTFSVGTEGELLVFNAYGQFGYWKKDNGEINTNYTALDAALRSIAEYLKVTNPNAKIGLPKIGCGLGGGDWSVVSKIIEESLGEYDVTVYELETTTHAP